MMLHYACSTGGYIQGLRYYAVECVEDVMVMAMNLVCVGTVNGNIVRRDVL